MDPEQPFILVRALPKANESQEFQNWFIEEHLPNIRKIPGITSIKWGRTTQGIHLGIYVGMYIGIYLGIYLGIYIGFYIGIYIGLLMT